MHCPTPFSSFRSLLFLLFLVVLVVLTSGLAVDRARADKESTVLLLFDGKTLAGWEGNQQVFRVVDSAIVAGTLKDRIARNEFLTTTKEYENFELRLEAKLEGEGKNAGVQFRSRRIPNHHEVIGYQCDMGEMGGKNIWGWLYDESRRRKFLAEAKTPDAVVAKFKANDWNHLRINCRGPRVKIWVNDVLTVDYLEQQADISRKGVIALQIHGGAPAVASYRNITLVDFDSP